MKDTLVELIYALYTSGLKCMQSGIDVLAKGTDSLNAIDGIIENITSLILPTAWTILAILCMIDIIDVITKKGEEMRWEDVLRILIKLVICKTVMNIVPYFMDAMFNSVSNIITDINGTIDETVISNIRTGIEAAITDDSTGGALKALGVILTQLLQALGAGLMGLGIWLSSLVVYVLAYARIMELLILQALSPIPCAFAGWQETRDIPKKFVLSYFAVCLQGIAMMVCFRMYIALANSSESTLMLLVFTVTLALCIVKSGTMAKQIMGLA